MVRVVCPSSCGVCVRGCWKNRGLLPWCPTGIASVVGRDGRGTGGTDRQEEAGLALALLIETRTRTEAWIGGGIGGGTEAWREGGIEAWSGGGTEGGTGGGIEAWTGGERWMLAEADLLT